MANEKRLIDANDVYSLFEKNGLARLHVGDIDQIQRVDAVEVVRCKDCKHSYDGVANIMCGRCGQNINGIRLGGVSVKEEHFCAYGERITE